MSSRIVGTVVRHYKSDNLNRISLSRNSKTAPRDFNQKFSFILPGLLPHSVDNIQREIWPRLTSWYPELSVSISVTCTIFVASFFYFCQFVMLITSSEMSATSERSDKQIQPEFSHCPSLSCRPSGLGRARVEVSRLWTDRGVYFPRCDWQSPLRWLPLIICQITPVLPLLAVQI